MKQCRNELSRFLQRSGNTALISPESYSKNIMQLGSSGLPKEESMAPFPTSSESFIFSFSFLGRGVLVPTLQMCESALPQAAPAVCLTRGAFSGRMDFLNLSSCFLYPHLLFCFNLSTFSYSSQYGSSLSSS